MQPLVCRPSLLGDSGVGKTAIAKYFGLRTFDKLLDMSICESYERRVTIDQYEVDVDLYDYMANEAYLRIRDLTIMERDGFILVYSVTSRESFDSLQFYVRRILELKQIESLVPVVVIGNKCDLEAERVVSPEQGFRFAASLGASFFETSPKFGINIDNALAFITKELIIYQGDVELDGEMKGKRCGLS